ncbi:MAG: type VI secretion system-associated FHA domain protein TagH [Pseudomonadota bacterium]
MSLIIHVRSFQDSPLPTTNCKRFDVAGGFIGRTPDNDLVLHDPHKLISRKHAQIECRQGAYYWTDLGGNASQINGLTLGSGKAAKLNDGDQIMLGAYVLEVDITPEHGKTPSTHPGVGNLAASHAAAKDHFLPVSSPYSSADPLGLSLPEQRENDLLSPHFRGSESDHISPELQALAVIPEQISLFSGATAASAMPTTPAIPGDYDLLADLQPDAGVLTPPTQTDNQHAENHDPYELFSAALMKGLGVPELKTKHDPLELAETVGAMLREALDGVMAVLRVRTISKHENRVDVTRMAVSANNPLKFFPSTEGALKQMLTNELSGYLLPLRSISLAFEDLKVHEIATVVGMRAALIGVLQRFDPAKIDQKTAASGVMDVLHSKRKAKMWDSLVSLHTEIMNAADTDFQRLFGDQFARAYEEQVTRLRNKKNDFGND